MESYYETINIVFIHPEQLYGTVEKLGAFASIVKYQKDGVEVEELIDNEDFTVMDEIVFEHIEEDK